MEEISIIVCSKDKDQALFFSENVRATVGCDFQLICIDNSRTEYSIFQAYNMGISEARNNIIVFVHEDVLFHTRNWGMLVSELFSNNPEFGLFGVAGANLKTRIPSGWWDCPKNNKFLHLIQHFPNGNAKEEDIGFESSGIKNAVVVDGVFLALRNDMGLKFNEDFKGFHGYDLNIGFEVLKKGFKIGITNSILLEHYSYGQQNPEWMEAMVKIHHFYRNLLPLSLNGASLEKQEIGNCRKFMMKCREAGRKKWFYYYWFKLIFLKPVPKFHYELARRFLT